MSIVVLFFLKAVVRFKGGGGTGQYILWCGYLALVWQCSNRSVTTYADSTSQEGSSGNLPLPHLTSAADSHVCVMHAATRPQLNRSRSSLPRFVRIFDSYFRVMHATTADLIAVSCHTCCDRSSPCSIVYLDDIGSSSRDVVAT